MNAKPISTLYSQGIIDLRNFKKPYPSWDMKKCEEDKNGN